MTALLMMVLIGLATAAGMIVNRNEFGAGRWSGGAWLRPAGYWLLTVLVSFELTAGALWDLLSIELVRTDLAHLGYPLYLLTILGIWRIPGALALLTPRFARLKEWAYAGAFFDFTGAAASHWLVGDGGGRWAAPVVLALATLGSWALRPASRRMTSQETLNAPNAMAWVTPFLVVAAMLLVAWATLPKA